jgi:hypothetical protein
MSSARFTTSTMISTRTNMMVQASSAGGER